MCPSFLENKDAMNRAICEGVMYCPKADLAGVAVHVSLG